MSKQKGGGLFFGLLAGVLIGMIFTHYKGKNQRNGFLKKLAAGDGREIIDIETEDGY